MIQLRSILIVLDNSGVKNVRTIQVIRTIKSPGYIGSLLVVSVVDLNSSSKIKKGQIFKAYLVVSSFGRYRNSGMYLRFPSLNGVVLVDKSYDPIGSRIISSIPSDLRRLGLVKLITLSSSVV